MDGKIKSIYTSPGHSAAFSGINNIRRSTGAKVNDIKRALSDLPVYTIKREQKRPRKYNPYFVWKKRKLLQIDLIDYSAPKLKPIVRANSNFKYLFCAIDTFTRHAWVKPMKNKKDSTCVNAFNEILSEMGTKPQRVLSDRGSEFVSTLFRRNLQSNGIRQIFANYKAGTVERFQRSLQSLITKYQKHANTKRFIDKLDLLLQTYNSRYHRTIKMSPQNAELDANNSTVAKTLKKYYAKTKQLPQHFNVGDKVRVQRQRGVFGRGYDDIFTNQIFNISKVNRTLPVPMYTLTTFDGYEELLAKFYGNELQKVTGPNLELVNTVKKERTPQGILRVFAKFRSGNNTLFAWVNNSDI